jgi:hypothetical protein
VIYTEKAYTAAGHALARASTEQAAKARARIIEMMVNTEAPADRARARELVANGEEEPPGRVHAPFFLTGCEADPCPALRPNQNRKSNPCSHRKTTHLHKLTS